MADRYIDVIRGKPLTCTFVVRREGLEPPTS